MHGGVNPKRFRRKRRGKDDWGIAKGIVLIRRVYEILNLADGFGTN